MWQQLYVDLGVEKFKRGEESWHHRLARADVSVPMFPLSHLVSSCLTFHLVLRSLSHTEHVNSKWRTCWRPTMRWPCDADECRATINVIVNNQSKQSTWNLCVFDFGQSPCSGNSEQTPALDDTANRKGLPPCRLDKPDSWVTELNRNYSSTTFNLPSPKLHTMYRIWYVFQQTPFLRVSFVCTDEAGTTNKVLTIADLHDFFFFFRWHLKHLRPTICFDWLLIGSQTSTCCWPDYCGWPSALSLPGTGLFTCCVHMKDRDLICLLFSCWPCSFGLSSKAELISHHHGTRTW